MKQTLTYDDIQIIPALSDISHRKDCNIATKISRRHAIKAPIVSAPMDSVTEWQMAQKMGELGCIGFIHRFMSIEDQVWHIKKVDEWTGFIDGQFVGSGGSMENIGISTSVVSSSNILIGAAIGVTDDYCKRAQMLVDAGVRVLLIDVAHGHHKLVQEALRILKENVFCIDHRRVDIIAGNIATADAAKDLIKWGADGLRVGIGNGSLCETRIRTGVGIPQITALMDIVKIAKKHDIPVIADGAIRTSGDASKALAVGADTVMLGSLFAGTKESPGETIQIGHFPDEKLVKQFRGSASLSAKLDHGESVDNIEGNSKLIPYKGKTKRIFNTLVDGIKSSMSYVGANSLEEFYEKAKFVTVTTNGVIEAQPHLMRK